MIAILLVIALWAAGLLWFVSRIPTADMGAKLARYDAIIVLTGGKERIPYALTLLEQDVSDVLFISGVFSDFSFQDLQGNIPEALRPRIVYGKTARDTIGNAQETRDWLATTSHKRLLVVTANYHIPRTRLLFTHHLPEHDITYSAVEPPLFERGSWLTHDNSRRLVLSEYHKWIASWLRLQLIDS